MSIIVGPASGGGVTGLTAASGTLNRVAYFDTLTTLAGSQLERTSATVMTLTGELQVTRLGVGVAASATYPLTISTTATGAGNQGAFGNWTTTAVEGTVLFQNSDHLAKIGVYSTGGAKGVIIGANASTGVGDAYHDSTGVLRLGSGGQFAFSSGTAGYAAAADTGIRRDAAGSLSFTNGSTGHATGLGLGTSTPRVVSGFTAGAGAAVFQVGGGTATDNRIVVSGETSANLDMVDTNAAANARWLNIASAGGVGVIRRITDNGGAVVDYFSADLATHAVTLGSASVTGLTLNPGTAAGVVITDTKYLETSGGGGYFGRFGYISGTGFGLYGTSGSGIAVGAGLGYLLPLNNGVAASNAIDLGSTDYRFRDGWFGRSLSVGPASYAAAPIGTVGSGTGVTVNATGDYRRVINKVTLTYAAWAAAATTADKTIYTLASKQKLVGIYADVTTPFTGGGVTAATMVCGKTVGGNEYLVSFDVLTAAITRGLADGDLGTSINRASAVQDGDLPSWTATTAITTRLTTVGANTNALTAGSITFYIITEMM